MRFDRNYIFDFVIRGFGLDSLPYIFRRRKILYETARYADSAFAPLFRLPPITATNLRSSEGRGRTSICRGLLQQGARALSQSPRRQASARRVAVGRIPSGRHSVAGAGGDADRRHDEVRNGAAAA